MRERGSAGRMTVRGRGSTGRMMARVRGSAGGSRGRNTQPFSSSAFVMIAKVQLPQYNGEGAWEPYKVQLGVVAHHYGWTAEMMATQLCLALEGKALKALVDLPEKEHDNLDAHKMVLRRQFGQAPATIVQKQ